MAGMAPTVRIRRSKADQESQGALRSLLKAESILCPSTDVIDWCRMRGRDSESGRLDIPNMRLRLAVALKFDSLSNNAPIECIIAHSILPGGRTTAFHAGYGLWEAMG